LVIVRKLLALGLVIGSGWLLYIYGIGNVLSHALVSSSGEPVAPVVIPRYLSADALVIVAEKKLSSAEPEALALCALAQDSGNGGAAAFLLSRFVESGHQAEADSAADLAARLWPVQTYTHSRLADYWISQDRVDKLIPELSLLLIREPQLKKDFFPIIEVLTIGAGKLELLAPYIAEPPNWWSGFFSYLSRRLPVSTLTELYELRLASEAPMGESERASFVSRLITEGSWIEAFRHWQAGLSSEQQSRLVNGLYDGGFEGDLFNLGFGWVLRRDKSFDMVSRATYGATGSKAIQIAFRQGLHRIKFQHLSQRLLLAPGRYKLSYRARADALKNPKGLVWRLRCVSAASKLLAEGEPMLHRYVWKAFSFEFSVPKSCAVQSLGLEAVSAYPHELLFSGQLWLDDVAVELVTGVSH